MAEFQIWSFNENWPGGSHFAICLEEQKALRARPSGFPFEPKDESAAASRLPRNVRKQWPGVFGTKLGNLLKCHVTVRTGPVHILTPALPLVLLHVTFV